MLVFVRNITTGKLVSLLDSCKADEGGRIAVLEAARKQVASALMCLQSRVARMNAHTRLLLLQVTHFIRVYEDMILDSERAP